MALLDLSRTTHLTPAPTTPLITFLERQLDMARSQTDRADTKAQLLGAALLAGAAVAVTVGSVIRPPAQIAAPAWATAATAVTVLALLGCTVWPRLGRNVARTDLEALDLAELAELVADEDAYARALHTEWRAVRTIARRKWRLLRWAMVGLGVTVALVVTTAGVAIAA